MSNTNFIIDKSTWKPVKFGDVVIEPKEVCKDIFSEGIEHVVGLEHIETGDIHLRESETTEESTTFSKKFQKGDVLFGRRRAYLKKAALADFGGICSGDITVFRSNKDLCPNLLPFIVSNDKFFDHAIKHSAGGLSPRVKFKDLSNYKFQLPPTVEQERLAELLWSMDDVIEKEKVVLENFRIFLQSSLKQIFQSNSKRTSLISLCLDAPKYGANSPSCEYDNNVRYIRITDIGDFGQLNAEKVSSLEHEDKYLLSYGDFLLARTADPGRSYYYKVDDGVCSYAGYLIKFKLDLNKIIPEYLYYYTQTLEFKSWINKTTRKGTISNINAAEFSKLKIPFVELTKQKDSIEKIKSIYKLLMQVDFKLKSSQSLQKSMINNIF
jgi:type I restriction enzyme S subunit